MATTVKDLSFNGYNAVLVSYDDGQRALWVRDEYLADKSDTEGTYTLNDINTSIPLGIDEDLDQITADWKRAVEWEEEINA